MDMNDRKKKKNNAPLISIGIVLIVLGLMSEMFALMPIGIFLIILHVVIKKNKNGGKKPQQRQRPAQPTQVNFEPPRKKNAIEYDAETKRAGRRREEDHTLRSMQKFVKDPHVHYEDLMQQARAEIRNLKNIRYARSELTGRTLSDTVIWHSRKGVCSSVVQVIRQGNLRYPDLNDRELSERILADDDLMQDLVRCLEWERRTEIRWN